ncbi:MAG: hypothetical protein V7742_21620 [Halioglobus sp.]
MNEIYVQGCIFMRGLKNAGIFLAVLVVLSIVNGVTDKISKERSQKEHEKLDQRISQEKNTDELLEQVSNINALAKSGAGTEVSDMLSQAAAKKIDKDLAVGSIKERRDYAIGAFAGFFYVNVEARPSYCRAHGVEITKFVENFREGHADEIAIATANDMALEKIYSNPQWSAHESVQREVIEADMLGIQNQYQLSAKQACELVEKNGVALAEYMSLSNLQPEVYEAIRLEN